MLCAWGGHSAVGRLRSADKRQALDGREDSLMVTAAAPRPAHGQGTLAGFLRPAGAGAASASAAVPGTGPACSRAFRVFDEQLGAPACKGGGSQEGSRLLVACGGWTGQPGGPGAACLAPGSGPVAQTGVGTDLGFKAIHSQVKGHVGPAAGTDRQGTLDGCFAAHGPGTKGSAATAAEQRIGSGSEFGGGTREEGAPGNSPLAARDTNALASGMFAGEGNRAASTSSALAKQPGCQGNGLSSTAPDAGVFASEGDAVCCAALPALAKRPLCQGKKPGSELPNSNAKRLRAD